MNPNEAESTQLNLEQMRSHEKSLKYYRDLQNTIDTARDEGKEDGMEAGIAIGEERGIEIGKEQGIEIGKEQGRKEGQKAGVLQVAAAMLQNGMADAQILTMTGLTPEQLAQLKEG